LSYSQFEQLAQQAHSLGLLFLSTPLDLTSAAFLETIVDAYKIASGDNNFYPLISHVAKTGKPVIVSTGVSNAGQVAQTVACVKQQWEESHVTSQLAVLHCVSSYPVPPEQANLAAIRFLAHELGCTVGYSDHTVGIEASLIAVALGARIIEKHFTLDKNYSDFHDHRLSADPAEMQQLVQKVRLVSSMLGKDEKEVQPAEETGTLAFRRSIVAGRDLSKGIRITWSDLTWIRPAGGLPPGEEHVLIGKTLNRDVRFGEQLHASDVEGMHD
jgi:sialic acid synthase SpsE